MMSMLRIWQGRKEKKKTCDTCAQNIKMTDERSCITLVVSQSCLPDAGIPRQLRVQVLIMMASHDLEQHLTRDEIENKKINISE
jgi:hypothetical protein